MASWLSAPVQLTGSREFTCDKFTAEQCTFYTQRWHFWYIADYVYALSTVAFFISVLGVFILGNLVSSQILGYRKFRGNLIWRKMIAVIRYFSYHGFRSEKFHWNSAPTGVLLLGAVGAIYFLCMDLIPQPYYWPNKDYGGSPPLATRSGWMGLACMPFVFATASKTNWITLVTGVSHEKLQVFHRWTAYAFFILALMHTFPFIIFHIQSHDIVMEVTEMSTLFYWTGIVALIFQAWLTFASHSTIRRLGYEFFKATHLFAVAVFVIVFFWHCDYILTSWHYFIATAAVYVPCFAYSWLRTAFEYGFAQKAHIHVEENGFLRLTISAVNMRWRPGQHCFLRFTSFGLQAMSSHPFTICSLPSVRLNEKPELVFQIRRSHGLTGKLFDHAVKHPGTSVPVLIDGPYGGINMQRYNDADRVLIVAGGSGAGWILPFIELFCRQRCAGAVEEYGRGIKTGDEETQTKQVHRHGGLHGPASMRVILATRDTSSRIWFLESVAELLARHSVSLSPSELEVKVHLTGEAEHNANIPMRTEGVPSSSSSDNIAVESKGHRVCMLGKELSGRPELPIIIQQEASPAAEEDESLSVFVCGPTGMQNEVRNAVASENLRILKGSKSAGVYLHSEHFSWA